MKRLFVLLTSLVLVTSLLLAEWGTVSAQQAQNVELVSQISGTAVYAVALQGNHAYIGVGPQLVILNVSDPSHPTVVGQTDSLPGNVGEVAVVGNHAYVAAGNGLSIINISDPAHPIKVGSGSISGIAWGVAISGTYAYVADVHPTKGGLHIINISDPTHPIEVGFYNAGGMTSDVAVTGNYAYITAGSWLRVINVADPTHPTQVGSVTVAGTAYGIAIAGDFAYVAWEGFLRIFSIATPAFPIGVGGYPTTQAYNVAVSGRYAYIAGGDSGLRIINISNPARPTEAGFYDTPGRAWNAAVSGNYIYVADRDGGLILWFAPATTSPIPIEGGTLTSTPDTTTYIFPSGTFTDTVIITHTPRYPGNAPSPGSLIGISHSFEVTAVYSGTGQPAQLAPGQTYTLTVYYTDAEKGPAIENTLALYWWDGSQWVKETSSVVDAVANTVTAMPNHFSRWAVLGETRRVFLPLVLRNYP